MKPTSLLLALLLLCGCREKPVATNSYGFRMENAHIEANGFRIYTVSLDGVEYVMATNEKGGIAIIPKVSP